MSVDGDRAGGTACTDRSQSEVIGVVLLTAVFIIFAALVGIFLVSNVMSASADAPLVDADANATTQYVTVHHDGGQTIPTDELAVVLQGTSNERYRLDSFSLQTSGSSETFAPGDSWRHANEASGDTLRVLVVHEPSNSILDRVTVEVEVTIAARFSTSPSDPVRGQSITFDAGKSLVRGSTISSYEWDFDDDGSTDATGETVQHSFSTAGSHPVTLTITAADGRTANKTKVVEVFNEDPDASFTVSPDDPTPGESVTFDASGSTDDSTITSFSWDFGDGTTDTGEVVTHTYDSSGDYTGTLTVTDDDGATDTTATTLSVSNAYFDVSIENTSSPVTAGETLTVNATINNTGNTAGTQDVTLSINGTEEDRQSVSLSSGETTTLPFTWSTSAGDVQDNPYEAIIASENDSVSRDVSVVQQQADVQINDVRGLTNQTSSHDYQVDVDVAEVNNVETQNLAVRLVIEDSSDTEAFNVTKRAPENFSEIQGEELTVGFDVGQLSESNYDYRVSVEADNAQSATQSGTFSVEDPAFSSLKANVTGTRGAGTEAKEVTFTYELTKSVSSVELTVEDAEGQTFQTTGSGATGIQQETVDVAKTPGGTSNNFPLQVTANISNGECLTATIQNEDDITRLADGDWAAC